MRIESTAGNEHKVWLTDAEIEDLRRATNSQRDDIIIQLGAFVGLRAFEIPQVRPVNVKETESGQYRLRVEAGKDTSGNGGKPRDAYLPDSVERDLQRYQNEHNIAPKNPYIDLKQPGVRAVVRRTAARAAEAVSDEIDSPAIIEGAVLSGSGRLTAPCTRSSRQRPPRSPRTLPFGSSIRKNAARTGGSFRNRLCD